MVFQNYWWLLIWIFFVGGLSIIVSPQRGEIVLGRRVERWNWAYAAFLAFPYAVWAGLRSNVFGDTYRYREQFNEIASGVTNILPYVRAQSKDKGYALIGAVFKTFFSQSDKLFFFFIAAIQLLCLVYIYRKFSRNYWLSMFMFIASTDYMSWMHNGMRQFIAVSIIFAAIPLLINKRYVLMVLVTLFAAQFHLSAVVFLPFIFIVNGRAWNLRTILFIALVIIATFFIDQITGFITNAMEDTVYEGDIEIFLNDDGTHILRVLFYSVPAVMALIFRQRILAADDPMINICSNLSIIAAGFYLFSFYTSGLLVGRIPIFFSLANYILIPWVVSEAFTPESSVLVNTAFVGVYSVFFYYQMWSWGLV